MTSDDLDEGWADEEELPEPPPVPTVEYLLGKRPVNLRKRASDSLRREIQQRAAELAAGGEEEDSDGHSSVSSTHSDHKHRKKKDKKRRKKGLKDEGSKVNEDDSVEWNYNKLSIPQSSPPRERKMGLERHPTPRPAPIPMVTSGLPTPVKLDTAFDEVSRELLALSDTSDTPSSLSPLHSPSPKSPISPASPSHTSTPAHTTAAAQSARKPIQPKRAAPKLPPHLQNRQMAANTNTNNNTDKNTGTGIVRKTSPISKVVSSRGKSKGQPHPQKSTISDKQAEQIIEAAKSPSDFMAALTEAISSSPKLPRFLRQEGVQPHKSHSPTMDDIELQINEMQKTLTLSELVTPPPKRPPSPEADSDSESSEYTSSDDSSSEDDTSSSDSETTPTRKPQGPRRPIMARNIGMSAGRRGNSVFSRARLLARYPRLLRRNLIKLEPILEVPEELIFAAVSL